jgi:hypothetical protein
MPRPHARLLPLAFVCAALSPALPAAAQGDDRPLTVAAVGDIMLGSTFPDSRDLPPKGGATLLAPLAPVLRAADLTFGNLEGPMLDRGAPFKKTGPHSFAFRVPTAYGKHLKDAGFDVMSCANNHANDFGAAGRASTRRTLEALGIAHAGSELNDVAYLNVRGRRIAVIAFAHGTVPPNVNDVPGAVRRVREAKKRANLVFVSFHGGGEGSGHQHLARGPETYLGEARGDLRRFAHAVIDAGAALVVGHGPHVVRGMEVYKGRLVAYSLGNFATYGKFGLSGPTALAPVLTVRLDPRTGAFLGGRVTSAKQTKPGGPRPDKTGAVLPVLRSLSRADFGKSAPVIRPDGEVLPPR